MKRYTLPTTEVIPMSEEIMAPPPVSDGVGEGEFGNKNTFEEDLSAERPMKKSLWDD